MARCRCTGSCGCVVTGDGGVIVTGSGSPSDPYVIDGGSGTAADDRYVLKTGDTASGTLTVRRTGGGAAFVADGTPNISNDIAFQRSSVNRWLVRCDNTGETGSDAGSPFVIAARHDDGTANKNAIRISRATGLVTLAGDPTVPLEAATKQYVDSRGTWAAYTPTLSGVLTLGNGTITGRWAQIGKTVVGKATVTLGSTSTVTGAGNVYVGLPVGAASGYWPTQVIFLDNSPSNMRWGVGYASGASASVFAWPSGASLGAGTFVDANTPFTWAVNDQIGMQFTYETV